MLPIKVPPLGESIVEATVSRWQKNEGDAVAAGDTLVELETDKITVEVPALKAGVLTKRAKNEGDVVHVDDVLGELDETAVAATAATGAATGAATSAAAGGATGAPASPASPRPISEPAKSKDGGLRGAAGAGYAGAPAAPSQSETTKSSPAARRIADERGIDIAAVSGTGRGGVVSKPDVLAAPAGGARESAAPRPSAPPIAPPRSGNGATPGERETREKMSTRRKRIAEEPSN